MLEPAEAHLLVAHPGHELLLHGWICRAKPVVHVRTDGSGHSAAARLVAAHRYARIIRSAEHIVPLRDALCAAVEKRSCAF